MSEIGPPDRTASRPDPVVSDGGPEDLFRQSELADQARFEEEPLTRPEYLNVLVHFYRAEVNRSSMWRQRLDATTNWAVLTSAGMLSFSFAGVDHPHILLLLTNLIVLAFVFIEARRYRRYEVYQARVRMLEENVLLPIISRRLISPKPLWRTQICKDLNHPTYKSRLLHTIGFRLRRNYLTIFGVLLGAWLMKLELHPTYAPSAAALWERMAVGQLVPPAVVFGVGVLFYIGLAVLVWLGRNLHPLGPADEVEGLEPDLGDWIV